MNRVRAADFGEGVTGIAFTCPGCGDEHALPTANQKPDRATWGWNGSLELPTLTPSVLARAGHYCNPGEQPGDCYCDFAERYPDREPMPEKWKCYRCHSFVTDGRIQFLADCTHALAGQTVDLPEIPEAHDGP